MEKILIIKHGALGDFVLAIGAMFRIARLHPAAELTLMTSSPFVSLGRATGLFSHYIIDNRVSYLRLGEMRRIAREVTGGGFERIYDLQGSGRTRRKYFPALRWLMPASFTWVHCGLGREIRVVKPRRFGMGRREPRESEPLDAVTDLSFLHGENEHFGELPEHFVLLIPGCSPGHPYKRWPVPRYCELVRRLEARGIPSVLIGTRAEAEELRAISAASPAAVNMLGKTTLSDVPDVARRAWATVGNDTGPTHMASLAGGPTISLLDRRNSCGALRGPRSISMISPGTTDQITVDQVWANLEPFLPPARRAESGRSASLPEDGQEI